MPDASTTTTIERPQRRICRHTISSQTARTCSSLLVPLMIAVFTIVTTMLQMNLAKQQREQDLKIAKENREKDERIEESRREKDFEIANKTRVLQNEIEDRRRTAEVRAQEVQQMNTVLAAYLKDMAELMLSRNFTLTDKITATVVRAKTLTTLGQLDGKHKGHLVRFLYEAQMINVEQPSVDLRDADLSSVDLTNFMLSDVSFTACNLFNAIFRKTILLDVDFGNAELSAASFDQSSLINVDFHGANLTDTSFIGARLHKTSFEASFVTRADFTGMFAWDLTCIDIKGNNTIFNKAYVPGANFTYAELLNASFVQAQLRSANMNNATLVYANFTDARLDRSNFGYSNLSHSVFVQSDVFWTSFYGSELVATKWLNTTPSNVDFSYANLSSASITDDQIRRSRKTFGIILPNGSRDFFDTNLLTNGDAEGQNGTCDTSPWHINAMIAEERSGLPKHIYGHCIFIKQFSTTPAMMWQRVRVPHMYDEWIQRGVALIQVVGFCVSAFGLYIFGVTLSAFEEQENDDEYDHF